MIHMPRRSVTRFFIPLIDVLLLFFIIFLLIPYAAKEGDQEKRRKELAQHEEEVTALKKTVGQLEEKLERFDKLSVRLEELEKLLAELERLKKANQASLQARTEVYIIDIDGKTGEISWQDPQPEKPENAVFKIADEKIAHYLIDKHQRKTKDKELYYFFLYPRQESGYPLQTQVRAYRKWFGNVANSLKETVP